MNGWCSIMLPGIKYNPCKVQTLYNQYSTHHMVGPNRVLQKSERHISQQLCEYGDKLQSYITLHNVNKQHIPNITSGDL